MSSYCAERVVFQPSSRRQPFIPSSWRGKIIFFLHQNPEIELWMRNIFPPYLGDGEKQGAAGQ
jgi:hypothetical protein